MTASDPASWPTHTMSDCGTSFTFFFCYVHNNFSGNSEQDFIVTNWACLLTEFVALRPKTYSYLKDDGRMLEKLKEQNSPIKRILKSNDYKNCLFKNGIILKS